MKNFGTAVVIGCLLAVNGGTQSVGTLLDEGFSEPYGIAVDSDNFYYITDSVKNRILQYLPNTGALTNYVGMEGIIGNQDGIGSFASFFNPQGILSITNANNQARLIVADSGNHRIRSVTLKVEDLDNTPEDESDSGKLVEHLAGSLTREVGLRDGIGEEALFNFPVGLAVDKDKNIYVADMLNHKIRKIDVNNRVTTLPVGGFSLPSDVAVDEDGNIYVADSGNNAIKMIDPSGESVRLIAGSGTRFLSGAKDALNAEEATFNSPGGLFWVGGRTGLLVADSGNGLLRRVFFNTEFDVYTTETFANSGEAEMMSPIGLAEDTSGNFIIVDLGGESLRIILVSGVPQPRVQDPVIGFIDLFDEGVFGNVLIAVTNATFNNDVIAAVRTEEGIQTFYEVGATDFQNEVPDPTAESDVPGRYENSMPRASFPPNLIDPLQPDVTIKAISTQADRRPSRIIVARYRFVAANPVVVGNNMASFTMRSITTNASIWFTTNGDDPVPDPNFARPYTLGEKLNVVDGTNDVIFKARAFKGGYASSSIIEKFFLHEDARFSTIGFSSDFMAGIGSTIVVPIYVNVLTNDTIRSLQYRVQVTPETEGAPPVGGGFRLLSRQPSDFISVPIPSVGGSIISSFLPYSFSDVQGLAVSFIGTNSLLNIVEPSVVNLLVVPIPPSAVEGQIYRLSILEASGTTDGEQRGLFLEPLPDKLITVTNISYVVGDSSVADWYNAGTFGQGNLDNSDVNNVEVAALGIRVPYDFTDLFDAMDSYPPDSDILVGGDGQIRFLDSQLTLQRSFRLVEDNWSRSWSEGGLRVSQAAELKTDNFNLPSFSEELLGEGVVWLRQALIRAETVENAQPNLVIEVPIHLQVIANAKLSGFQFRMMVVPEDENGAPIVDRVEFHPAEGIPAPRIIDGVPVNQVALSWGLNSFSPNLTGDRLIGTLRLRVPVGARSASCYRVLFFNADGAPDLFTQYDFETIPGCIWIDSPALKDSEMISSEWKDHFFGGALPVFTDKSGDPDADGMPNWAEFLAGTNPTDFLSHLKLTTSLRPAGSGNSVFSIRWLSAPGKFYQVEKIRDFSEPEWMPVSDPIPGTGDLIDYQGTEKSSQLQLYRVRLVP